MDATEAAAALVEWAIATCPDLNNVYDHDPAKIQHALPVAIAGAASEGDRPDDPSLGLEIADFGIQQTTLHVLPMELELIVAQTPTDDAARQLESFVAALRDSLRADRTLGGRVFAVSPWWQASYKPPFVEFDDSVTGRRAVFTLTVAELT